MADLFTKIRWKRFWIPRETFPHLDRRGYFADPESDHGKFLNPKAQTLEELETKPCVVLLGEPGIGKSHVLQEYRDMATAQASGGLVLYADFRWHRDLDRAIFATAEFQRWLAGHASLTLILDSLDEHQEGAAEVASRLVGELQRGPVRSLRLRIACRTAEWPGLLDEQLPQLWKYADGEPVFYALAPLRQVDVAAVAGENAGSFFEQVAEMGAEALAIKPITLGGYPRWTPQAALTIAV